MATICFICFWLSGPPLFFAFRSLPPASRPRRGGPRLPRRAPAPAGGGGGQPRCPPRRCRTTWRRPPPTRAAGKEEGSVRHSKPPGVRGDYPAGGVFPLPEIDRSAETQVAGGRASRRGARGPGGGAAGAGKGGERLLRASRGRAAPVGAPAAQAGGPAASPAGPSYTACLPARSPRGRHPGRFPAEPKTGSAFALVLRGSCGPPLPAPVPPGLRGGPEQRPPSQSPSPACPRASPSAPWRAAWASSAHAGAEQGRFVGIRRSGLPGGPHLPPPVPTAAAALAPGREAAGAGDPPCFPSSRSV